MKKIKILVLSLDNDGVGSFRINSPYLTMNDATVAPGNIDTMFVYEEGT